MRQGRRDALHAVLHLRRVAAKLLAEGERRRIHGVRPPDLDDGLELVRLSLERLLQLLHCRQQPVLDLDDRGNVHHRREGVVGTRALVDVVVRVDDTLVSQRPPENLDRAIRNDLVGVHVGLGPGARLPHHQRKVVHQLSFGHFPGSLHDRVPYLAIEHAEVHIHLRSRPLEDPKGAHDRVGHALARSADLEVHRRPLGLGAPVLVRRDLQRTERVILGARRRHQASNQGG